MPNINKTLKGINQGMQLLDTLQGGSSSRQKNTRSGSYDSYDTRSSSHSKGGLSQGLQLLGSLSGSHGQSGGGGGGLSKVLSSFTGAGGRRTSSDDREYGDRGRDRGYDRDSDRGYDRDRGSGGGGASSRRLRDECEDEISFHRRAITKLSEAKEQALRAAQAALKANADDGDRALGLLRQKEAEAARAGNQAQASALGLRAQEMELSCRSRLNKHQLAVEKNQFEFDKALQTHRQLLELLERQMGEIDRGGLPTLIRERPTTIPDPHVVPLESINTAELLGGLNVAAAAPAQAYGQQAYSAAPQQQTYSATPQQQAYSAAPQASAQPQRPPSPYLQQQQQAPEQQPYGASYPAPASAGTHLLPPSMPAMPSMPSMPPMSGSPYSASQPDGYAKAPYGFPPSQSYQQQPGQQSPGIGFRM